MPPPTLFVALPEMVELLTVRVPELLKPPPKPAVLLAPETVTPEMLRLPPVTIVKILKPPAVPLMISEEAPGPVMVRVPAAPPIMVGSTPAKVMVPVSPVLKTIVSLPAVLLARSMASRRVPPVAVSAKEVTGKLVGTILPSSWRSWGGAGSSCFSILWVAKETAESI